MKNLNTFLAMLFAALLPLAAWGDIYTDPSTGVVYEYDGSDEFADSARVAPGLRFESDLFSQMARFGTEISSNVTILESIEANGKTYSVTTIGTCAFAGATNIRTVTIPKSIFTIEVCAFSGCSSVTDIYCHANPNGLRWTPYYDDFKSGRATVCHVLPAYLSTYQAKFSNVNVTFVGDLESDGESVGIVSTFDGGWTENGIYDNMKVGVLSSNEGNAWQAIINNPSAPIRSMTLGSSSSGLPPETCVCIGESGTGDLEVTMVNNFTVTGHVKKVIVRTAPNVHIINAYLDERSGSGQDAQHAFVSPSGSGLFSDNVLKFDGTKNYQDAAIRLTLSGVAPFFIHSVTIIQSDGEADVATSGTTGSLTWQVEEAGTIQMWADGVGMFTKPAYRLTISGTGYMPDYTVTGYDTETYRPILDTPWHPFETITEVVIGEGVKNIGRQAFQFSDFLWRVTLPSTLERIEPFAFHSSSVSIINFPEGLNYIGNYAFRDSRGLQNVALPSTLTDVYPTSFMGNNIQKLTVADGNPKFDSRDDCNAIILTAKGEVVLGTPATVIPGDATSIGARAFNGNNYLTSFEIPSQVTSIGEAAFDSCFNMKTLIIGSGVKRIQKEAFAFCMGMEDVLCYADPTTLTWDDNDNMWTFLPEKAARFHIMGADQSKWQTIFPNLNATYVADLLGNSEAIAMKTTVTASDGAVSGAATTTESGVTVSLGAGDTVDPEEGSVTLTTSLTSAELATLLETVSPGTAAFVETFKGYYFLLAAGKGYVDIDIATLGSYAMGIMEGTTPIGDYTLAEKGTVRIEYDLTEDTWFFIYPSSVSAPTSVRVRRASAETDGALKVFSIQIVPTEVIDAIDSPIAELEDGAVYNLSGQRISRPAKGLYIVGGKKILMK